MADKVLMLHKKNYKTTVKVRRKMGKGYSPNDYLKILNPNDANDLALLFEDLSLLLNSPIEEAFRKFKDKQKNPFF